MGVKNDDAISRAWELQKQRQAQAEERINKTKVSRILTDADFKNSMAALAESGYIFGDNRVHIHIADGESLIKQGLKSILSKNGQWLCDYQVMVEWLADNRGKGLLVMGTCGTGKTLICGQVLPLLLHMVEGKIVTPYTAQAMNGNLDKVMGQRCVYLDDIGTEETVVSYGNRRDAFCEIVDNAERTGNMIIATTNLNTQELKERYGERTVDRLRAICKVGVVRGPSMR